MKLFLTTILSLFFWLSFSQESIQPFLSKLIKQFPNVRDVAISPNGNEVVFTAQSVMGNLSAIVGIKKKDGKWSNLEVTSFSGQHFDLEPFFSNDGLKLYFASNRPINSSSTKSKDFDIWYTQRETLNDNWSNPINMGKPVNTDYDEFYPSISDNGNLYFTRDNPTLKMKDDIYVSEFKDGTYSKPKILPNTINSVGYEYNAFIAPDESYLIFGSYNRKDGFGSGDLYISFNSENGWAQARNLGNKINSDKMDYCPFVDTKTDTLYFTSKRDNTNTKLKSKLNIKQLHEAFNKHDNGLSRLYKVSIMEFLGK